MAGYGDEQIDLDGDNDYISDEEEPIEEPPEEEDGYRRDNIEYNHRYWDERNTYGETPRENKYGEAARAVKDEYDKVYREGNGDFTGGEKVEPHIEGDEQETVSPSGMPFDVSETMKDEDHQMHSPHNQDHEKHAELLALPPHGSEIFIGGIPRDAGEQDLREHCEPFGDIFEVRLVKEKDRNENKGYAFVLFTTRDAAQKAIEEIHDTEFKGKKVRCSLSQTKYRLFIGNVPKSMTEEELRKILDDVGPGIENFECLKDPQNPSRNRGFLFVEYYNNACADYAKQKMSSSEFKMDGSHPSISWAEPKNIADSNAAYQVKVLYVKNLPDDVATDKLKELFGRHGEVVKVILPAARSGNKRGFGFVHYAERSSALKAVKGTEKYEIDGHELEVCIAKPQTDKKHGYAKAGLLPNYPQYPYGHSGDPYGAYGSGYGAGAFGQPMIYGRGPMPAGMKMVPMVLPDGRIGYVIQQPGMQHVPPPPRRRDRGGSSNEGGGGSEGNRGRRYHPY